MIRLKRNKYNYSATTYAKVQISENNTKQNIIFLFCIVERKLLRRSQSYETIWREKKKSARYFTKIVTVTHNALKYDQTITKKSFSA